jgi:hypothetical protein
MRNRSDELLTERIFDEDGYFGKLIDLAAYFPVAIIIFAQVLAAIAFVYFATLGILMDAYPGLELWFETGKNVVTSVVGNRRLWDAGFKIVLLYVAYVVAIFVVPAVLTFVEKKLRAVVTRADLV